MAKRILKHILKNWNEYEVWNHKAYTVTEDFTTVTTEATLWTSPYDTSYWYTNITIDENSWIKWKEWAIYSFVVNSEMVVASDKRNVRVRIGSSWSWIPMFSWNNSILNWNDYLQKEQTRLFIYKTTYQSTGALHLLQDTGWITPSNAGTNWQVLTQTSSWIPSRQTPSSWWTPCYVDVFIIWWWWGGGWGRCSPYSWNYYYWWGWWWGGWYVECRRLPITSKSNSVWVGTAGTWWAATGLPWSNGWDSYFWNIYAYWWGWGGGWNCWCNCCEALSWWNTWWDAYFAQVKNIWWHKWWKTQSQWYSPSFYSCRSWGWGAGGDGRESSGTLWGTWGNWIYSNFDWTYKCYAWGWGWASGSCGQNGFWAWMGWWGNGWGSGCGCNATCCWWWWGWGRWECANYSYKWGNGACWIVYVRYPSDWSYWFTSATWWTKALKTIDWVSYCVHTFTSSWTFTISS